MKRSSLGPPNSRDRKQVEKTILITLERKDDPEGGAWEQQKIIPSENRALLREHSLPPRTGGTDWISELLETGFWNLVAYILPQINHVNLS